MKKEDKTNRNRHKVENKSETPKNSRSEFLEDKEKLFTLDQVQSLAALIAAGVMGIGGQECIEQVEKLPIELKKVLVASVMAARECMMTQVPSMLASVLAKAGK